MKRPTVRRFAWYCLAVPRCAVCGKLLEADAALSGNPGSDILCADCRADWEREKLSPCSICGEAAIDCRCLPSVLVEAGAEVLMHLGEYRADGAVGRLILRLKEHRLCRAADFAAAQLIPGLRRACAALNLEPGALTVAYLPRSKRARRFWGHDQAELVARALAGRLGATFAPLLTRASDGAAQKTLSAGARRENVVGAFVPARNADCRNRAVLLFDDVLTTGASMAEGVRVLREAGARCVLCAVFGVTVSHVPAAKTAKAGEKNKK